MTMPSHNKVSALRDAAPLGRALKTAFGEGGVEVSLAKCLQLSAHLLGTPRDTGPSATDFRSATPLYKGRPPAFSLNLEETLRQAALLAEERNEGRMTREHLLLALVDDWDAGPVLTECVESLPLLKAELSSHLDAQALDVDEQREPAVPNADFHRIMQNAVSSAQSSGPLVVNGNHVLLAILSDTDSDALNLLGRHCRARYPPERG